MALFKVTNKRLILNNGQRIEAVISAEEIGRAHD